MEKTCRNISTTFIHSAEVLWMPEYEQSAWWTPAGQHIRKCYFHQLVYSRRPTQIDV